MTRWSVIALIVVSVATLLVGFVWLPQAHSDFTAKGLWDTICRAAGVPERWGRAAAPAPLVHSTYVVLEPRMAAAGTDEAIGRGATLAQQCTMCHGAKGLSQADTPNLAGQYRDVILKQLVDYQRGDRTGAVMQSLAANLGHRDMEDLAAYFASLPKLRNAPVTDMSRVPPLVKHGDPMRNVAPCAACHGGMDRKIGAPWLEGMPKEYLVLQLTAFASGERHNDSHAQMRNMARALTRQEIDAVSDFYARHPE